MYVNTHIHTHTHTHTHTAKLYIKYKESRTKKTKNLAPLRYTTTTLTLTGKVEGGDGGVALKRRRHCLDSLVADLIPCTDSQKTAQASVLPDEFLRGSPSSTLTIHSTHTHNHIKAYQGSRGCVCMGRGYVYSLANKKIATH